MPYCPSGRGASRLEKMVAENPSSACCSGLGNHLRSLLNQRACHTQKASVSLHLPCVSGEWAHGQDLILGVWYLECMGLYCEEIES